VPVMLSVVAIVNRSKGWYEAGLSRKSAPHETGRLNRTSVPPGVDV
jgi:hypothetical protein